MLKANAKAGVRETLIIGLKQTTALYHTKETASQRPLRASMADVGESLDLLAQYGGLDPATKGKPTDWVVLDFCPDRNSVLHFAAGNPMRPPLIRMRGVTKVYRTAEGEVESLKPLEFDIHEGEFLSIVGPSGCGKSTLLKLVGGLLPVTSGSIDIAGQRVDGPAASIGIVFQSHVLLAWRTVLENIMLQIEVRKLPHKRGLEHARELIAMVGLTGFEKARPLAAFRRHATARVDLPRTGARSGDPADGRAVRCARRDDTRKDESRAAADMVGGEEDRVADHT